MVMFLLMIYYLGFNIGDYMLVLNTYIQLFQMTPKEDFQFKVTQSELIRVIVSI